MIDNGEKIFGEKLEGIDYITRVGVYGIAFNDEGKIAIMKTSKGYYLPGGGIEGEESHFECIKREFLEETGYEIIVKDYINKFSIYHKTTDNVYFYFVGYFYIVSLKHKTNNIIEDDNELVWIEPNQCISSLKAIHQSYAVSEALKYRF